MINEEIARKTLNMEINAGKVTGKVLLNLLKKLEVSQDGKERRTGKSSGNH